MRGSRRVAFRVVAFLFGAAALGALFGIGLVIGWFDTDEGGIHRVHELGFGIAYGVLVGAAFFAMVGRRAVGSSLFLQVIAVALAVVVAAFASGDPGYAAIGAALIVAAAITLALYPARADVLHPHARLSVPLASLAMAGAVPLVAFALTAARLQRDGSSLDPHVNQSHWTTMASMALALVAVGLLASARITGWRFTAWCAGLGVALYGLASMVFSRFPGSELPYAGSEGTGWGVVALVGGLAFITVAEWEARRATPGAPPHHPER
jgi:hypothetical protein